MASNAKLGIIAGNRRFPFLVLDVARAQGYEVVVAAIREETSPGSMKLQPFRIFIFRGTMAYSLTTQRNVRSCI